MVVNCFKMCIFALSRTTNTSDKLSGSRLWIASKCVSLHYHVQLLAFCFSILTCCELLQNVYLCIITYNPSICRTYSYPVVNCFKMCIFALSRTTERNSSIQGWKLWIASKCVSLHYHVQPCWISCTCWICCELLQNVYLCIITYNEVEQKLQDRLVVNCFKMCIFALSRTTESEKHLAEIGGELLQNVYLCIITYNL